MSLHVKQERSGWRDESLSARHRLWGFECPMVDIDFLAIEYNKGKPSALVEYKNEHAAPQYRTSSSYLALIALGDAAEIPVIAARYADDFSWWLITPLNEIAQEYIEQQSKVSEEEWVRLLYKIRKIPIPDVVVEKVRSNPQEMI